MYHPAGTGSSSLPTSASNVTGSQDVDTDLWGDKEAIISRSSDKVVHCNQTTLSLPPPPTAWANDPFSTPGPVNEPPLRGFPTINAINLYHLNANLGLVTPQQQTDTLGPSTGRELQIPRPYPHTQPAQRELLDCIIPGCNQQFRRSDALGNHLRKKHRLPIPRRRWAATWIFRVENYHYYIAAVQAQLRANGGA